MKQKLKKTENTNQSQTELSFQTASMINHVNPSEYKGQITIFDKFEENTDSLYAQKSRAKPEKDKNKSICFTDNFELENKEIKRSQPNNIQRVQKLNKSEIIVLDISSGEDSNNK